jgi:hypothetical protein
MSEPWFNPNLIGGLLGATVGVLGGTWGSLAGVCAPRGKCKGLVLGSYWLFLAAGVGLLATGIYAFVVDQPWGVWFGLLLPGAIMLLVFGPLGPVVRMRYHEADLRKMQAAEFE